MTIESDKERIISEIDYLPSLTTPDFPYASPIAKIAAKALIESLERRLPDSLAADLGGGIFMQFVDFPFIQVGIGSRGELGFLVLKAEKGSLAIEKDLGVTVQKLVDLIER
jgi:hypothetical protein